MNERLDTYENLTNMEDGIDRLNDEYGDRLAPRTLGQRNVSAMEKIIVTLRYFASGDFQINDGDIHKLSQPSVSRTVTQFTEMLANQETMTRNITFPTSMHDITRVKTDFQGIANFANVVGSRVAPDDTPATEQHIQDIDPDTKVPDGRTAGRTTPKQYPSASGGG
ncbi:hypothetical protein DPMN_038556 [Dreissena polymorpha]|uniref:Uncharacterized protein n=1 Tax=Dreissena polymorpha TaxID=45954 RepID=A0A9D4RQD7_DREPO|nr:hypothetical protein DPMN_038556 [Dreissena polymorpha]